MWEVWDY